MKVQCICGAEVELDDVTATAKSICVHCGRVFSALNTEAFRDLPERKDETPPYDWLGLTPDQWPPDHYTLLGVRAWETRRHAIVRAAHRRHGELQPLLDDPATHAGAMRLKAEIERAVAVLTDPDRLELYVTAEKARRAQQVRGWVEAAVRRGPVDRAAIKALCRRCEALGVRRSLCLKHLRDRGVEVDRDWSETPLAVRVFWAVLLVAAMLASFCYMAWQFGWLSRGGPR